MRPVRLARFAWFYSATSPAYYYSYYYSWWDSKYYLKIVWADSVIVDTSSASPFDYYYDSGGYRYLWGVGGKVGRRKL